MGLANLVPGISGGTMLVAVGIYTRFIDAISNITRLKITKPSVLLLGTVGVFFSAVSGRTLSASVMSYAFSLFTVLVLLHPSFWKS